MLSAPTKFYPTFFFNFFHSIVSLGMNEKEAWALNRCMTECSRAEKCRSDIVRKLEKWGIEAAAVDRIVQHLEKERYLDEGRYATYFARDKFRFNKWGKVKIEYQLRLKKIPDELIEEALQQIDPVENDALLVKLIREKQRKISWKNAYERNAKLVAYARSKGFELNSIFKAINSLKLDV